MEQNKASVQLLLQAVKTEQFAILSNAVKLKKEVSINTAFQVKVDFEKKLIIVNVTFEFHQTKKNLVKLGVSCHFIIEPNSWLDLVSENSTKISLPNQFLHKLFDITVGAARGILHSRTEGTIYSSLILPLIDVSTVYADSNGIVIEKPFS